MEQTKIMRLVFCSNVLHISPLVHIYVVQRGEERLQEGGAYVPYYDIILLVDRQQACLG